MIPLSLDLLSIESQTIHKQTFFLTFPFDATVPINVPFVKTDQAKTKTVTCRITGK